MKVGKLAEHTEEEEEEGRGFIEKQRL